MGLGVVHQRLHDALGLRIGGLAEVRPEPVVRREPHVVRRRDHPVRDHAALQARHPVREDHLRHPAHDLEALREHAQRRGRGLIGGEPHEPEPAPRHDRAEHVQPELDTPVDHQMLTRRPDRRPAARRPRLITTPSTLRVRDQPPEVPVRPLVARRPSDRQQPLRGDPPLRRGHLPAHQVTYDLSVGHPGLACRHRLPAHPGQFLGHDLLHGPMRRAADLRGTAIRPDQPVAGDDVHTFLSRLHSRAP